MTHPFQEYLEKVCFSENPTVLDDDMPEFFDNWLTQLEGEDLIAYGNQMANAMQGINKI